MGQQQDHFGVLLKAAREKAGLSLRDIADETCVSLTFLNAIDHGNHDDLPASAFVKGFIKSYALAVNVDPEEALAAYKQSVGTGLELTEVASQIKQDDQSINRAPVGDLASGLVAASSLSNRSFISAYGITAALGLIVTVSLMVNMTGQEGQIAIPMTQQMQASSGQAVTLEAQSYVANAALKVAEKSTENKPAQKDMPKAEMSSARLDEKAVLKGQGEQLEGADLTVKPIGQPVGFLPSVQASAPEAVKVTPQTYTLMAVEDSWLQIHGRDGETLFEGMLIAGQKKILPVQAAGLTTGNAGAFELILGDKNLGVLGARGAVKENLPLKQL